MSGSWKVAYSDFMTAMMAFFLLMWILNMAPPETKEEVAQYFAMDPTFMISSSAYSPMANNVIVQKVTKLDAQEYKANEVDASHRAIARTIRDLLMADSVPTPASGISSDNVGVLLHVSDDALFDVNTVTLSPIGYKVLDDVIKVIKKYKVYLVVRGHTSMDETGTAQYPTKWELSSARAIAAVRYIIEKGKIDPSLVRSVAYADTRPLVPENTPESSRKNRRVEFYFHRPEVMSTIVGY